MCPPATHSYFRSGLPTDLTNEIRAQHMEVKTLRPRGHTDRLPVPRTPVLLRLDCVAHQPDVPIREAETDCSARPTSAVARIRRLVLIPVRRVIRRRDNGRFL